MVTERDSRKARGESVVSGHLLILISIGVAVGILVLIGVLFVVGLSTKDPSPSTLAELGVAGENAVQTIAKLRAQRFDSIKQLVQLLVIALAVPMLAIALGYFSERTPRSQRKAAARGQEPDLD